MKLIFWPSMILVMCLTVFLDRDILSPVASADPLANSPFFPDAIVLWAQPLVCACRQDEARAVWINF